MPGERCDELHAKSVSEFYWESSVNSLSKIALIRCANLHKFPSNNFPKINFT